MYVALAFAAMLASALTFFTGFGLGTILLPVFALFFPPEIAIGLTAIVHVLNGLFKFALTAKHVSWPVVLRFGLFCVPGALLGSWALATLTRFQATFEWSAFGCIHGQTTLLKVVVASVLFTFALIEFIPKLRSFSFDKRWLPVGGMISGFFGGLSGHQGALRSAFLLRLGLTKETFVATGVATAILIDLSRLSVYGGTGMLNQALASRGVLSVAVVSAFAGAVLGMKLLKKMTIDSVQTVVGLMILIFSIALGAGLV